MFIFPAPCSVVISGRQNTPDLLSKIQLSFCFAESAVRLKILIIDMICSTRAQSLYFDECNTNCASGMDFSFRSIWNDINR